MSPITVLLLVLSLAPTLRPQDLTLLADIGTTWRGSQSASPRRIHVAGGTTYFGGNDAVGGVELYKSDGTPGSGGLLKEIEPGRESSDPRDFVTLGSLVVFSAYDSQFGREPWVSDGTTAGTRRLVDIAPGINGSEPIFSSSGGLVFIFTLSGAGGLWRTDGTPNGTYRIFSGQTSMYVHSFAGTTVFTALRNLYVTDGTVAGTLQVTTSGIVNDIVGVVGNSLFTRHNQGLGIYSPTLQYTGILVRSDIINTFPLGSRLLFAAGNLQRQLWITDGTTAGTTQLSTSLTEVDFRTRLGNGVLFAAMAGGVRQLWFTDGTATGTNFVSTGFDYSSEAVTTSASRAFFTAWSPQGPTLFTTDGTASGTVAVPGPATARSLAAIPGRDAIMFAGSDPTAGEELWTSDGTPAGTQLFADVQPGQFNNGSLPMRFTSLGDRAFFIANSAAGYELWFTDGTPAGTRQVADIYPGVQSSQPSDLTVVGEVIYFVANDGVHGREVWRSDGTTAGTYLVKDIQPGTASSTPTSLAALDEATLMFAANDPAAGQELWRSDGTTAGTSRVADIAVPGSSSPRLLTRVGNRIVFFANNNVIGYEPWITDGTTAGTRLIADTTRGPNSDVFNCVVMGNRAYFTIREAFGPPALWGTDGTAAGTTQVPIVTNVFHLLATEDKLFFSAWDGSFTPRAWVSNGRVSTMLSTAPFVTHPEQFTRAGDSVVFLLPSGPPELWTTQGDPASTQRLTRLASGTVSTTFIVPVSQRWTLVSNQPTRTDLLRTDGTSAGTSILARSRNSIDPAYADDSGIAPGDGQAFMRWVHPSADLEPHLLSIGATAHSRGIGCGEGVRAPTLSSNDPVLGSTVAIRGRGTVVGASQLLILGEPLARGLPFGDCTIYVDLARPNIFLPVTSASDGFQSSLPIPNDLDLLNVRLALQAISAPSDAPRGFDLSNKLIWNLGY